MKRAAARRAGAQRGGGGRSALQAVIASTAIPAPPAEPPSACSAAPQSPQLQATATGRPGPAGGLPRLACDDRHASSSSRAAAGQPGACEGRGLCDRAQWSPPAPLRCLIRVLEVRRGVCSDRAIPASLLTCRRCLPPADAPYCTLLFPTEKPRAVCLPLIGEWPALTAPHHADCLADRAPASGSCRGFACCSCGGTQSTLHAELLRPPPIHAGACPRR